jgi:hypothetical protein
MMTREQVLEWLSHQTEEYSLGRNDSGGLIEDMGDEGKLGQGFSSVDRLEEMDIGDGVTPRQTFINANLSREHKKQVRGLVQKFTDCFAWEYTEMPVLSRELVEHRLPTKPRFRPYRQPPRNFNPILYGRIKEEIDRLLRTIFIQPCRYAEWVWNIVPVEKKNTDKIRVCVDFRDLNRATPKDEYPMPNADMLINNILGNRMISFLDGNVGYNQIFMATEDISKTAFRCPSFIGLFEWVEMTFGLKNARATYQCAMNLIFHDLLGTILEIYIDDVVVKSADFEGHLADLQLAFERMRKYGLKMNPLKCAFGLLAGRFLGFVVHERGIEVDPKKVEAIRRIQELTCKKDLQSLLGKVNYLRRFISNLAGKIESLLPLVRIKYDKDFTWGIEQKEAFERIKEYLTKPLVLQAPKNGRVFRLYIAASDGVIGAMLAQENKGKEGAIAYLSRRLLSTKTRYT